MPTKVEISYKTIVFFFLFLGLLWALLQILDIILLVFVAFIIMSGLRPLIDKLEGWRVPRLLAVLVTYILIIGLFGLIGSTIVPPFISQTAKFISGFPKYLVVALPAYKFDVQMITQQIAPLGENIFKVTLGIFSNILVIFTLFVVSFYFLLERKHLQVFLEEITGKEMSVRVFRIFQKVEERLGEWLRSQLILAITIGLLSYLGLFILNIDYALPLAIIAGLLEIVPIIGPIISAIPAILIALTISPFIALATVVMYFIVQQVEAQLIVPLVMKRTLGLPPVVTILVLMIGSRLDGIGGALLSIPAVLTLQTIVSEVLKTKSTQGNS